MQKGVAQKDHVMMEIHCNVMEKGVAHCRMVVQLHCELVGMADQH